MRTMVLHGPYKTLSAITETSTISLARKKAEFKEFGRHVDLVIVSLIGLLTGFDAYDSKRYLSDRTW